MELFFYTFIFLFGIAVGSFLNVVIIRLHEKKWIGGRSYCPRCSNKISWYDNIPIVSFLLLWGKCRYCRKRISIQYPLVETVTGILFVLAFERVFVSSSAGGLLSAIHSFTISDYVELLSYFYFISILTVIFVYDLRWYLILDIITLPAAVIAVILNVFLGYDFLPLILAGLIGGGFFLLQFIISRGRWIGGGDIRLGLLMGFMLGYPMILVSLMLAYLMGGVFSIVLLVLGKKHFGDKLPFGTFLTVSAVVTLLYGNTILNWYLYSFLQ